MDVRNEVPPEVAGAVEEVRAHLAALRGGGLFLSSADSLLLVQWLDAGVEVPRIVLALERAAEARRARRSRFPLQLTHAKRHLGKPVRGFFTATSPPPEAPLRPMVDGVRSVDGSGAAARLEQALAGLRGLCADALFRDAAEHVRAFFVARWEELGEGDRATLRAEARDELGELVELVDEATAEALIEEGSRDRLRARYPWLSAASLWELAERGGVDVEAGS